LRILHFINDLHAAGSQVEMLRLLGEEQRWGWNSAVVTLADGRLRSEVAALGVPVFSLGMRTKAPFASHLRYLTRVPTIVRLTWRWRPNLVQGWMYHANLAASLAAACRSATTPVLWRIGQTISNLALERPTTAAMIRAGGLVSRQPAAIIYNSEASAHEHEALGYKAARRVLMAGGFDCDIFQPSLEARGAVRRELGLAEDAILVGLMARFHPMKDHAGFLRAARLVVARHRNVFFVLAGSGVTAEAPELMHAIAEHRLEGRVFLLGMRRDMARLNGALDLACSSSSRGEGFSNAIGEAMACGVPCVVTDVGDSARLVGNSGIVVPPGNPLALADAISTLVDAGTRAYLGTAARRRIESEFALKTVAQRYRELCETQTEISTSPTQTA
jgi:glycosyltransferase involved in cell wall biosynthesis